MEKTYVFDSKEGSSSNAALWATLANNKGTDPMATAAMMNGGMNNWMNNP